MNICLAKFAMSKRNGCIIFLHSPGIFAKCPILSFPRLQTVQLFQNTKEKPWAHCTYLALPQLTSITDPTELKPQHFRSIKKFETLHDCIINS